MSEFQQGDLKKYVFSIEDFKGKQYINIRLWQREDPRNDDDWHPTRKGVFIPMRLAGEFRKCINKLIAQLESDSKRSSKDSKA